MISSTNPRGALGAAAAMALVGTLTAVSATLDGYPIFGGQALRYTLAAALLLAVVRRIDRRAGRPGPRPTGREWGLLVALAATGLVTFNVCVVAATEHIGPATVGTVIATVPILLAVAGPLQQRRRPRPAIVASAVVVAVGAGLATGLGGANATGLLLALGALGGEVCFTLLAVPLLPRLGAFRVSAYSAGLAVPMLVVVGLLVDGRGLVRTPTAGEAAALFYLAAIVTTVAFFLWYDALGRLGADRAGLFAGLLPISAVVTSMALGLGRPGAAELAGAVLVAAGVAAGLRPTRAPAPPPPGRVVISDSRP
ncbi:DMT family transporter [Thermomonospora umbrina]|uniref:Drug/metabolite transporter (DMT)-like permease n=1 Tax=Thermomonospora umbrina TaxID=111806 RepID=A0A3D9SWR5_9ACTN|nr:DMT family transporter [Thermomonospora umbrina]REE96071.1 drug/metabolite transporter (DMT)-like permease [Thermomonospora umbrina]